MELLRIIFIFFIAFVPLLSAKQVGLLIVATGKYIKFVPGLIKSAEKHFCPGHQVTFFVFTDDLNFNHPNTFIMPHSRLGWPYDTLMRFHAYKKYKDQYKDFDYLYACDADMLFVDTVGDEIFGNRMAVIHPGFYNSRGSYETNPKSLAYVGPKEGKHYFCGGFYGGKASTVLKQLDVLIARVDQDLKNKIIAVWHDESHLNRYYINNPPDVILNPSYCYPESWNLPFPKKLLALDKPHEEMRE